MKDDFNDFLSGGEQVPASVSEKTLAYILVCLNPKRTLAKFYFSNVFGGITTVAVCPQYGFGPIGGEAGVLHYVMSFGPIWCGIFCASVFTAGANFFSLIFLKDEEKEWISRHSARVLVPWITLIFFVGMIGKYYAPGELHHNTVSYHVSWYSMALVLSFAMVGMFRRRRNGEVQ